MLAAVLDILLVVTTFYLILRFVLIPIFFPKESVTINEVKEKLELLKKEEERLNNEVGMTKEIITIQKQIKNHEKELEKLLKEEQERTEK